MSEQNKSFGVNLWWTVPTLAVPAQEAQTLLAKYGFEKDDMKEPSDRVEVSRAVHSFQNRRTKADRRMAEIASEKGDKVVYGLLDREQVNGSQVDFMQRTTVTYDKNANTVNVTGALVPEVEAALVEYRDKITDVDVRYFLRKVVKMCHGVAKRPTGGIYFVPTQFVGVIDSAKGFLAEMNSGARLYVERVVDGEQERAIVWEAVEDDLDDQLSTILSNVERVEKRVSALRNQEAKVGEIRDLMKTYQDLLGREAKYEDMAAKLDAAVATIAQKMTTMQADMQTTPTTPVDPNAPVKKGRGHSQNGYFDAVVAILKVEGGPLLDNEIAKRVKTAYPDLEEPSNVYNHLYSRAKKGWLKLVGARKFELVVAAGFATAV
jgi:hypothetical protein